MTVTSVIPIPAEYLPTLQALKMQYNVPISWIAAVCGLTGWNANFEVYNTNQEPNDTGLRQFGLAGIWADIPEIIVAPSLAGCIGSNVGSGWFPTSSYIMSVREACPCTLNGGMIFSPLSYLPWQTNLDLAAKILAYCAQKVKDSCGVVDNRIFLYFQMGCHWPGNFDPCKIPADMPPWVADNVTNYTQAQALYADQVNEPPLQPPGGGGSGGGSGDAAIWIALLLAVGGSFGLVALHEHQKNKGLADTYSKYNKGSSYGK